MAVAIRRDLIPDYDLSCCLLPMTSWHFLVKGLGIGAAVLTSFSCAPQVRKALPQRSTADVSLKTLIALTAGLIEEKEKRGFIKLNLISLAFTLAGIGVLLLALGTVVVLPIALNYLGLHNATDLLLRLARWPLLIVIVIFGLAVLYRYGPSRREPRWQWISVGSAFAAIAWLVSSALLSWYLVSFAHYDASLRLPWRRHRHDDVDVDFFNRDLVWRPAQFRNRAPDGSRFDRPRRQAARRPRRRHGGYGRKGTVSLRQRRCFWLAGP